MNRSRGRLLGFDHAATTVEIANDVANVVFAHEHVQLHDWLEDLGARFRHRLAIASASRGFERDSRGVDGVIGTVGKGDFEVDSRVSGEDTTVDRFREALFDGWPEFARYVTAGDHGLELKATTRLQWLNGVVHLGELARATGLLLVRVRIFDAPRDGLAVGNLGLTDGDVHLVSTLQDVALDVQVQLAHALDDGLAAVLIGFDTERRIFLDHLAERDAELLGRGLVVGRDGHGDDRFGKHHRLQRGRMFRVGQRVARLHVLQTDQRDDVAGLRRVQVLA